MRQVPNTLALLLVASLSEPALAQEVADAGPAPGPSLTPPELVDYVKADYPPEAFAQGLEAAVSASLDIDENGLVTNVKILEPAGHGFDEAAEAAMRLFVFKPAMRGAVPIPSRVIYKYTFFLKKAEPAPEAAPPPPLPASLKGVVHDMDGKPVTGASVALTELDAASDAGPAPELSATTDATGAFALADLPAGSYQVDVVAVGFKPFTTTEKLAEGESLEVVYRLEAEAAMYETVVRGRKPPREVTRREITTREITRIPGTGGDAIRSVQNMPGLARASYISGELIVRGSAPADSRVFFDSMPVPLLYHFGGLTSVINSDLLERIDFFPGNYSVRYTGATGGIIDVYPRAPKTDRIHAYIDADIWDVGALVETPLGKDWSVAVSARRSYIDGILTAVLPDNGGLSFSTAPRYYDYQAVADYHPDKSDNLRLFLFGSDDEMVALFGSEVVANGQGGSGAGVRLGFHQLQAKWDHRFDKVVSNQVNVGVGYTTNYGYFGEDIEFALDAAPIYIRDEVTIDPGEVAVVRTGIDTEVGWSKWLFRAPDIFPMEGESSDPLNPNTAYLEDKGSEWGYRPGWYGEVELTAIPRLRLINGLRLDYSERLAEVNLDPRFVARYEIVDGTTLKGGIGLFHQAPQDAQVSDQYGNPDLEYINAIHYGLGFEQEFTAAIEAGIEGFYKDLSNMVVSSDRMVERDGQLAAERYNNDGVGRVAGFEVLVKHKPTDRLFGWISYTLMQSWRVDHPGEKPRLFDNDQTHILTIVASVALGRGWEAGVRFRLVSGNPDTPVQGAAFDADGDQYFPIYGERNTTRLPLFHQLDLRLDKRWDFGILKFSVYVDVQNVYNQKNVEGYAYSYDFSARQYQFGLPLLPSLGFKLEY
ncbi:MAG: TonB family protein [Deltaproteobacteria bacterium]|nr:TonB family protein [Deltaproteobacteria bacterium]